MLPPNYSKEAETRANQLLRYYFNRLAKAAGVAWTPDTVEDVEWIIPSILDAFQDRVTSAVNKAMVGPRPGLIRIGSEIIDLSSVYHAHRSADSLEISLTGSPNKRIYQGKTASALWEIIESAAVKIETETEPKP